MGLFVAKNLSSRKIKELAQSLNVVKSDILIS
jgi:hypothetical protein